MDHAIAEILPALCMDRPDFEARYPPRRARAAVGWPSDDVRDLPGDVGFEDDIESLFDAPELPAAAAGPMECVVPDAPQANAAVSYAAATISSFASGHWW